MSRSGAMARDAPPYLPAHVFPVQAHSESHIPLSFLWVISKVLLALVCFEWRNKQSCYSSPCVPVTAPSLSPDLFRGKTWSPWQPQQVRLSHSPQYLFFFKKIVIAKIRERWYIQCGHIGKMNIKGVQWLPWLFPGHWHKIRIWLERQRTHD